MMQFRTILLPLLASLTIAAKPDYATACYSSPLPSLTPSSANRMVPWGQPSFNLTNGTTCCDSLDQVRAGIDAVDQKLLHLLAQRAAYVREATRFKPTLDAVDVPSRDKEVVDEAVKAAKHTRPRLPETVARRVFRGTRLVLVRSTSREFKQMMLMIRCCSNLERECAV